MFAHSTATQIALFSAAAGAALAGPAPNSPLEESDALPGSAPETEVIATFEGPGPVRDWITEPFIDEPGDGFIWVRGRDYRASFGANGLTFLPVLGKEAPSEIPVRLELTDARRGGVPMELSEAPAVSLKRRSEASADPAAVLHYGAIEEVDKITLDGVEQTFVIANAPGRGALRVSLEVETTLEIVDTDQGLEFRHADYGTVRYGEAIVVDASGATSSVQRERTEKGFDLVVPESFLDKATLPITIDPLITFFGNGGFGAPDDSVPDITAVSNGYVFCWEEFTSATNADVFLTAIDLNGTYIGSVQAEITNSFYNGPRIAYTAANDTLLMVADVVPTTTGSGRIEGRFFDATTLAPTTPFVLISSVGVRKREPDVAGNNDPFAPDASFCVTWSNDIQSTLKTISTRVVHPVNSSGTIQTVSVIAGFRDREPDISNSNGSAAGWMLAFVRDLDGDGRGAIMAHFVPRNGNLSAAPGLFIVSSGSDNRKPSVSSAFQSTSPFLGTINWFVSYQQSISVDEFEIRTRVVDADTAIGVSNLKGSEVSGSQNGQTEPAMVCTGRGFALVFGERISPTTTYQAVTSGNSINTSFDTRLGYAEQGVRVSPPSIADVRFARASSRYDADRFTTSNRAAVVYERRLNDATNSVWIGGAIVASRISNASSDRAVGEQYCFTNPNSTSPDTRGAWTWILGRTDPISEKTIFCTGLPPNSLGYLLTATGFSFSPMPGGSQGNLCLSNGVGRYVGTVLSSGSLGQFSTTIDPTALPQPNGPVAAMAGETWGFQFWHRDVVNGAATSNFSMPCRIRFN